MRTMLLVSVLIAQAAPAFGQPAAPRQASFESGAGAEQADTADPQPSSFGTLLTDLVRDLRRLPSKDNAIIVGLGGAAALAAHPADRTLTERASRSEGLDALLEAGGITGSGWLQIGGAMGAYVIAHAGDYRRMHAVSTDLLQAQILNTAITQGIKLSVRRARPDAGRFSFPSGHASGTFATAAVLHRHFGWKVGLPAYGFATYVGASRLQENRHYASDVIFGAAVGLISGRTVTVGRGAGRFVVSPIATRGGAGVTFTRLP